MSVRVEHDPYFILWLVVGNSRLAKTRRASAAEVEQVIANADSFTRSRHAPDRVMFQARTNGGRPLVVVAQLKSDGRIRPITAWEDR